MEIDITQLSESDMFPFSHSVAEGGENAGRDTWNSALHGPRPLLKNAEEIQQFKDWLKDFGAWDNEERAAWDDNEAQALFLQFIAGNVRECPARLEGIVFEERWPGMWYFQTPKDIEQGLEDGPHATRSAAYRVASDELVGLHQTRRAQSLDEVDWEQYEVDARAGRISSNLYKSDTVDGVKYYFTISH